MERIPFSVGLGDKTSNILVDENEVVAGIDAGR